VEGVGCCIVGFAHVAVAGGCGGFEDGVGVGVGAARGGGGVEGVDFGGRAAEESDFLGEEGGEWEGGGGEWGFEEAGFGRDEVFLVGGWDGEGG